MIKNCFYTLMLQLTVCISIAWLLVLKFSVQMFCATRRKQRSKNRKNMLEYFMILLHSKDCYCVAYPFSGDTSFRSAQWILENDRPSRETNRSYGMVAFSCCHIPGEPWYRVHTSMQSVSFSLSKYDALPCIRVCFIYWIHQNGGRISIRHVLDTDTPGIHSDTYPRSRGGSRHLILVWQNFQSNYIY